MPTVTAMIQGKPFILEVARNREERAKGLSGRHELDSDKGMLFPHSQSIWMKDCHIPLDLIFVKKGRVQKINHSVPPVPTYKNRSDIPTYRAPSPSDYVIELSAGTAKNLSLKEGDDVSLSAAQPQKVFLA